MTPFEYLFVAHFVGDIILQTDKEGLGKKTNWLLCLSHATKWTLTLLLASWLAVDALSWRYLLLLVAMGLLHALIDRRWMPVLVLRWKEYLWVGDSRIAKGHEYPMWLVIWVDQTLHLLQIATLAIALDAGL